MSREIYKRSIAPHQARVATDGGVPTDAVNAAILLAQDNQEFEGKDKCLIYSPELTGNKIRVNGIYQHATKGYEAGHVQSGTSNNLTQTTANSQPYMGKINASKPQCLQNQNGDSRFMSHPAISFAANEKWTVEVVARLNGEQSVFCGSVNTGLYYRQASNAFRVVDNAATPYTGTVNASNKFGKITHFTFVKDVNNMYVYVNGILHDTINITGSTTWLFNRAVIGIITYSGLFYGSFYEYAILPNALSATRIAYRYALLRSIFPEIPTVRVGGLDVACRALDIVCTPAGTLIPNVTDNSAWAALTTPAWCHHTNDIALGTVYGKIFNGYAKDQIKADLLSSNFGYHIATEAEWNTILATGVAGLKAMGTNYWTSANGTNVSGVTLLGGAWRNESGVFDIIKTVARFWCGDSDKRVSLLDSNLSTNITVVSDKRLGYYILLIKDY